MDEKSVAGEGSESASLMNYAPHCWACSRGNRCQPHRAARFHFTRLDLLSPHLPTLTCRLPHGHRVLPIGKLSQQWCGADFHGQGWLHPHGPGLEVQHTAGCGVWFVVVEVLIAYIYI
jgi:hypothetical protein